MSKPLVKAINYLKSSNKNKKFLLSSKRVRTLQHHIRRAAGKDNKFFLGSRKLVYNKLKITIIGIWTYDPQRNIHIYNIANKPVILNSQYFSLKKNILNRSHPLVQCLLWVHSLFGESNWRIKIEFYFRNYLKEKNIKIDLSIVRDDKAVQKNIIRERRLRD